VLVDTPQAPEPLSGVDRHVEYFKQIEIWKAYHKERKGITKTVKASHTEEVEVEFCFPVGAPLEDCYNGKIDESFMQPRSLIEKQIKGTECPDGVYIFPKPGQSNPSNKEIYWTHGDPFTIEDASNAPAFLVVGMTGSGKTTLIEAMVNWAWGVEYDEDQRYKLIYDETDHLAKGEEKSELQS
jgi:hypothetical protein